VIQDEFCITLYRVTSNKETSFWLSIQTVATRRTAIALAAIAACLAFLHFVEPPTDTHFLRELLSTGHILVFGLIALLALVSQQSRDVKAYLGAFVFTLALGAASELLQGFSPDRDASLGDLARDASGAAVFLCLAAFWRRETRGSISSVALAVVAVLSLSAGVAPLVLVARDYAGRNAFFPKLCCFTGTWEQRCSNLPRGIGWLVLPQP
jgi:VanZ family protein